MQTPTPARFSYSDGLALCHNRSPPSEELLLALFAETKRCELSALSQAGVDVAPLIAMQYGARSLEYAARHSCAEDRVLWSRTADMAGRLLLDCSQRTWRIVDLAVLSRYRGQGIATKAICQVQKEAQSRGAVIRLSVVYGSPAIRLYERLGFRMGSNCGPVLVEMEHGEEAGPLPQPIVKERAHAL